MDYSWSGLHNPVGHALLVAYFARGGADRALAAGAVLYLCYVLYTGADYMGGRFFTYPYLLAVIAVVAQWEAITSRVWRQRSAPDRRRRRARKAPGRKVRGGNGRRRGRDRRLAGAPSTRWQGTWVLAVFGLLWMLVLPHTPLKSPFAYHKADPIQAGGVSDERAAYHKGSSLADYVAFARGNVETYPDHPSARLGSIVARANVPVIHMCDMGMMPFAAGTERKFIDIYGYSDVLQSRLPGLNPRPGHVVRMLPEGYLESVAAADARILDARLNRYYERLRLVTQSDQLFSAARLRAILMSNLQRPPTDHLDWRPVSAPLPMPLLCYAKHDPGVAPLSWTHRQ